MLPLRFKKHTLSLSIYGCSLKQTTPLYLSCFFIFSTPISWAETNLTTTRQEATQKPSLSIVEQHEADFAALEAVLPLSNTSVAQEVLQIAEQAKHEALQERAGQRTHQPVIIDSATDLAHIQIPPQNIDQLMSNIQNQSEIIATEDPVGATITKDGLEYSIEAESQQGWFARLRSKFKPANPQLAATWRIQANVIIEKQAELENQQDHQATLALKENITAKLSSFTQESFRDFEAAVPQLRILANQAAQAVGFYNAKFTFERVGENLVDVKVIPHAPVIVESQNIDLRGAGAKQAHFSVIQYLPDLTEGDIFHHGHYENTKKRINETAQDNGYFDAYWRLHDVKVAQPQNTADIHLWYDTGERYRLGDVQFKMADENKNLPLDLDILYSMVPWKKGADYTFWRVNSLANNLTNSRYFNHTLVSNIQPDPVEKPLELAPDIQRFIDEDRSTRSVILTQEKISSVSTVEVSQDLVNEQQFAGIEESRLKQKDLAALNQQDEQETLFNALKQQAYQSKEIPVIVTLNADDLNSAEVGLGYGADTGTRLRAQYHRAIVNRRGHAFGANLELSRIRQSIDGRYSIPYHHPLHDYVNIVGGYEREERGGVAPRMGLVIESAVLGADRIIKNPFAPWQHSFGIRYRLDRLLQTGHVEPEDIPDAFLASLSKEQQSLLFGYELVGNHTDRSLNPLHGFKQIYKVEVGNENVFSDANMAILNAGWHFIYSLGENYNHQFVGRTDLGYILTEDFKKVPYNLRYFTGGDQSIRGFDYKSLAAQEDGFKIGGQALAVASLEYNYQFREGMRAAVFTDFGNAYDRDFNTATAYGVGIGFRWASPIGSLRIDLASGLSDEGKPIRLHFFIGSPL